jgi:Na+-translocating ferredoxin:NAD+ oxidoreductase subunit B
LIIRRVHAAPIELVDRIDAALPQTQCTRCGFPDCRSYGQAIASGEAAINRCPPGGAEGVERLHAITGLAVQGLDQERGVEGPRAVAIIDEAWCIGCTLCIQACPVDCIVGAAKVMHTVVEPHCTGCELCVPACPVDCIAMLPVTGAATGWQAWSPEQAQNSRERYAFHQVRTKREARENDERLAARAAEKLAELHAHSSLTDPQQLQTKRAVVEAALARARARRCGEGT